MSEELSPEEVLAAKLAEPIGGMVGAETIVDGYRPEGIAIVLLAALDAAGYSIVKLEFDGSYTYNPDNHVRKEGFGLSAVEGQPALKPPPARCGCCAEDWPCSWADRSATLLYEDEDRPPDAVPLYRVLSGQVTEVKP